MKTVDWAQREELSCAGDRIQMLMARLRPALREHFARTLSREVAQRHSDDTGVCVCVCV